MSPELEALTPAEAEQLANSPERLVEWLEAHGVAWERSLMLFLLERSIAERAAPIDDARRSDGPELREFVERAVRLPPRMAQVAQLCLADGLSLRACADRLAVSRETVRVHLRRLRAIRRRVLARSGGSIGAAG